MIKAVILAGDNDKQDGILNNKATCMIGDKMMIEYVLNALKKSQCIDQIVVVGDKKKLKALENYEAVTILQCKKDLVDNVLLGLRSFPEGQILVATSDIPMVTEEAIKDFVLKGQSAKADLAYSVIEKEIMEAKYPNAKRTFVKLKDGEFTGGNLFLVESSKINRYVEIGKKMLIYRKKPWKMVALLGITFLFKLITGRLTIADVEKRVGQLMNIKGKAIISHFAEVGNDVDKLEDLQETIKYMTETI